MNKILFLVPILLLLSQLGISAVRINTNGGYNITIALKESIEEPKNVTLFLNNIRAIVQDFSTQLHVASRKKFYIHSANILIPATWTINSSAANSVSYKTADIRIISEFLPEINPQSARVENPNTCGTAGTYMEIPLSFFDNPDYGIYGKPGKALTNLWARYRFGVWEEHGYPDDSQFPYLYQKPSLNIKWSPTGCSDNELSGKFINSKEEKCALDVDKKPDQDCKFEPSLTNNTAVSSLLTFPWINSVAEFCDLRTHNYAAPNRQNFLCGHRSVWDVIRETADYKKVSDDPIENIPQVMIDIVKVSPEPLFYILFDVGKTSYPVSVIKEITSTLTNIFTDAGDNNLGNIITSVGSFPTNSLEKSGSYVNENVPWSSIATSKQKFIQALDELSVSDGPVVRDFAAALQETIELIKLRNHPTGAVIVVLKKGATPNYFDRITYEQDVIASLHGLTNIKLMAIELQENDVTPYVNLVNIVKETKGTYLRISDDTNIGKKLGPFVESVKNALKNSLSPTRKFRVVTKQTTRAGGAKIEIPVLENDFINLQVHLTTSAYIRSGNVEFIQLTGDEQSFEVEENDEWGEKVDAEKRYVHTMIIQRPMKGSVWSVGHTCLSENATDCSGYLVVYGEIENSDKILSVSDTVDITVSTSADDGYVDMSLQGPNVPKVVPFTIHAKIEIDGQPILHLSNVNAVIRLSDKSQSWKIPLQDTGNGISDISLKDGIYSNIFTPLVDGFYSISVVVEHNISHDSTMVHGHTNKASGVGRLIPVSQGVIGCYNSVSSKCYGAHLTESFSKVADLPGRVLVANSIAFLLGKPVKITDFKVTVQPNFRVVFSFTAPELLGSNDSPEEFQIFMAPSPNNFLGSTNLTYNIVRQIGSKPGTYLEIQYYTVQLSLVYYGVEAIYKNIRSGPSNIVGVNTERPTQSDMKYKDIVGIDTERPTKSDMKYKDIVEIKTERTTQSDMKYKDIVGIDTERPTKSDMKYKDIVEIKTERTTQSDMDFTDKVSELASTNTSIDMNEKVVHTAVSSSKLTPEDITKIAIGISVTCVVLAIIVVIYRCRQARRRGKGSIA